MDEVVALAEEKGFLFWKAQGIWERGCLLVLTDKPSDAVQMNTAGTTALRSTGSTFGVPCNASYLARAYAELGQLDAAWACVNEALTTVEKTKERFWEAEVHRVGGEIALMSDAPDAAKAEAYFKRALSVSRQQQAKSWELRAAMSFDTLDLKEAKVLLEELVA